MSRKKKDTELDDLGLVPELFDGKHQVIPIISGGDDTIEQLGTQASTMATSQSGDVPTMISMPSLSPMAGSGVLSMFLRIERVALPFCRMILHTHSSASLKIARRVMVQASSR